MSTTVSARFIPKLLTAVLFIWTYDPAAAATRDQQSVPRRNRSQGSDAWIATAQASRKSSRPLRRALKGVKNAFLHGLAH